MHRVRFALLALALGLLALSQAGCLFITPRHRHRRCDTPTVLVRAPAYRPPPRVVVRTSPPVRVVHRGPAYAHRVAPRPACPPRGRR